MNAKRRSPLSLMQQRQSENRLPLLPSNAPVRAKKRSSAKQRNLSPLPEVSGRGPQSKELREPAGDPSMGRASCGTKKMLHLQRAPKSFLHGNKTEATARRNLLSSDNVTPPPSSAGLKPTGAGETNCIKAKVQCGMRRLRIIRDVPIEAVASEQVAHITCDAVTQKGEAAASCTKEQKEFENAIGILNRMMEIDAKNNDSRAWVTRFTEGTAEARLRKEELLPVWIIVSMDSVLAIDLNGTTQHRNYVGLSASEVTRFPPSSCIVFPFQDALKDGEVRLPENVSDVATMMMPAAKEIRWGVPVGVLFINSIERNSIVRDILQVFIPSFLQKIYPHGVPLKGAWTPTASASEVMSTTSRVINIPRGVRESVVSCMTQLGISNVSPFMGSGTRLGDNQGFHEFQQRDKVSQRLSVAESLTERRVNDIPQQPRRLGESPPSVRNGSSSPWESRGSQLLFTARLVISNPFSSSMACSVPCHSVLVLTPRGPLELVAEPPSSAVTVKDVKLSLLRSGLGRSLRLQKDMVRFTYAPSLPMADDGELINARYAVMRLKTQNPM
ncbi:hypothetical protein TraAM80_08757 [Trypanosoma rangeli]|uniref:Uncharacterized protein n=1 Tax=Trypanosoma rangeli TaxID=5698 RepID=A0A422MZ34_TRYRA|nr:uncharacterized protein TraAM80_08757 [Trypanosoma rangeli]RNE98447.1 hypothetical protein TraAM80_08757 [Trypanosoma rangeli]|eukprot:RNE98447.1 hypothetical protein TraAM80_08757 [Trypanosoma rangeli]